MISADLYPRPLQDPGTESSWGSVDGYVWLDGDKLSIYKASTTDE